jgi:hypothetical protein
MAFIAARISVWRGRPLDLAAGINGSRRCHCALAKITGKGRSQLSAGRPKRLRPHFESAPPNHLGGGESHTATSPPEPF